MRAGGKIGENFLLAKFPAIRYYNQGTVVYMHSFLFSATFQHTTLKAGNVPGDKAKICSILCV